MACSISTVKVELYYCLIYVDISGTDCLWVFVCVFGMGVEKVHGFLSSADNQTRMERKMYVFDVFYAFSPP